MGVEPMKRLIHHIDVYNRYTGEVESTVTVRSEAFDIILRSEDNYPVLTIGEDTHESRKQLLLYDGEDGDTLFHLRYTGGTLNHIRQGDSREVPILSDNEADPHEWMHPGGYKS